MERMWRLLVGLLALTGLALLVAGGRPAGNTSAQDDETLCRVPPGLSHPSGATP
jgi:hypothetical protein